MKQNLDFKKMHALFWEIYGQDSLILTLNSKWALQET